VRPFSQFLHSCICERFIYSQEEADRFWEYINRSHIHECGKWETEHYNSVLGIMRLRSFIAGNTSVRTRHLYWILNGPVICSVCTEQQRSETKNQRSLKKLLHKLLSPISSNYKKKLHNSQVQVTYLAHC
jgi:hypothetical protein